MRTNRQHSISRFLLIAVLASPFSAVSSEQKAGLIAESDVKSLIVEVVKLDVCLNYELLEYSGIEIDDCDTEVAEIAPVCWFFIDKLDVRYEIEADGKLIENDKFHNIANVFELCIQSEMMMQIVREMQRKTISEKLGS